ncbi:MAG: hypothetical protein ACREDL_22600, partial [Bradyrhizobium sp.]
MVIRLLDQSRRAAAAHRSRYSLRNLQPSSNGNLRSGAEALGNPGYEDTSVFETIIGEWANLVRDAILKAKAASL